MRINVKILKGPDCSPILGFPPVPGTALDTIPTFPRWSTEDNHEITKVSEETSVQELKRVVSAALGVPVERQRLVFKGKAMQDDMSLLHYGVTEDSKIILSVKDPDSSPVSTSATNSSPAISTSKAPASGAYFIPSSFPASSGSSAVAPPSGSREKRDDVMRRELLSVLLRHFTPNDAEKVVAAFYKEMEKMVAELSLDDIERIAKVNLANRS